MRHVRNISKQAMPALGVDDGGVTLFGALRVIGLTRLLGLNAKKGTGIPLSGLQDDPEDL